MKNFLRSPTVVSFIRNLPLIAIIAFLVALPFAVQADYAIRVFVQIGIYILLVSSLNLVNGYGGMFSVGHAAYYGIGAYASALLVMKLNLPFAAGMVFAGLASAALAWVVAKPTLKLKGVYLTLVTLGFNIIVMLVFLNWDSLTKGPLGLAGIPAPKWAGKPFTSPIQYYFLVLALDAAAIFFLSRLVESRFGRALKAVREDDKAAATSGVDVAWHRETAFIIAAAIAGVAGSVYAHYMRYISPDAFSQNESFAILTVLAFGGPSTMLGPIAGSIILVGATELFRAFSDYRMLVYGILLVLTMLFRREGLCGGRPWRLTLEWPPKPKESFTKGDRFLSDEEDSNGPA